MMYDKPQDNGVWESDQKTGVSDRMKEAEKVGQGETSVIFD